MSFVDALVSQIENQVAAAFWTVVGSVLLFMLLGFVLGVVLVVACGRRRIFTRRYRVWTWCARLNYVYVPLLLTVFGGLTGGVYGAHRVTRGWIDASTRPVVAYAQAFLPTAQNAINHTLNTSRGDSVTLEGMLGRMITEEESNPVVREAMFQLNLVIVRHAAENMVPEMASEPVRALSRMDLTDIRPGVFEMLPRTLHRSNDTFFFYKYLLVCSFLFLFLLLPVGEYLLHRVVCGLLNRWSALRG